MFYAETLLNDTDYTIIFNVNTDAYDKQLGAVISNNNKPISFYAIITKNMKCKYTTTEKELILIVECLKQTHGILFGYEINLSSDNKIWFMPPL